MTAHIMRNALYTIGYHSFSRSSMLETLRHYGIGALVDIRAWPSSRLYPAFDASCFGPYLRKNGIYHLCMGQNLGVRPEDSTFYTANRVDYAKIAASVGLKHDLERLFTELQKFPVCLMCKEEDPAFCHRAILVAWQMNLKWPELPIWHLLKNGQKISQSQLDAIVMKQKDASSGWLLSEDFERQRTGAYLRRSEKIAWRKPAA